LLDAALAHRPSHDLVVPVCAFLCRPHDPICLRRPRQRGTRAEKEIVGLSASETLSE
jgi:hypothetical protein